jgi:hypothetical protein
MNHPDFHSAALDLCKQRGTLDVLRHGIELLGLKKLCTQQMVKDVKQLVEELREARRKANQPQ